MKENFEIKFEVKKYINYELKTLFDDIYTKFSAIEDQITKRKSINKNNRRKINYSWTSLSLAHHIEDKQTSEIKVAGKEEYHSKQSSYKMNDSDSSFEEIIVKGAKNSTNSVKKDNCIQDTKLGIGEKHKINYVTTSKDNKVEKKIDKANSTNNMRVNYANSERNKLLEKKVHQEKNEAKTKKRARSTSDEESTHTKENSFENKEIMSMEDVNKEINSKRRKEEEKNITEIKKTFIPFRFEGAQDKGNFERLDEKEQRSLIIKEQAELSIMLLNGKSLDADYKKAKKSLEDQISLQESKLALMEKSIQKSNNSMSINNNKKNSPNTNKSLRNSQSHSTQSLTSSYVVVEKDLKPNDNLKSQKKARAKWGSLTRNGQPVSNQEKSLSSSNSSEKNCECNNACNGNCSNVEAPRVNNASKINTRKSANIDKNLTNIQQLDGQTNINDEMNDDNDAQDSLDEHVEEDENNNSNGEIIDPTEEPEGDNMGNINYRFYILLREQVDLDAFDSVKIWQELSSMKKKIEGPINSFLLSTTELIIIGKNNSDIKTIMNGGWNKKAFGVGIVYISLMRGDEDETIMATAILRRPPTYGEITYLEKTYMLTALPIALAIDTISSMKTLTAETQRSGKASCKQGQH